MSNESVEPNEASNKQVEHVTNEGTVTKYTSVEAIDELANMLVESYSNPDWRKWYCGAINEFGLAKVEEWYLQSLDGKYPERLFTFFVKSARKYSDDKRIEKPQQEYRVPVTQKIDVAEKIYIPGGDKETDQFINNGMDEYLSAAPKAIPWMSKDE